PGTPKCTPICSKSSPKRTWAATACSTETLVFFGSELSEPPSHDKRNMPFLLAGGDGKAPPTNRWLRFGGQPHNRLLTAILNLFGDSRTQFGDSRIDSTPIQLA